MRVLKALNPRNQRKLMLKFGVYDKVLPVATTPSRIVPQHIEKPDYVSGSQSSFPPPNSPEIKDVNQILGVRRSCALASTILSRVENFIQPNVTTDAIDEFIHNATVEAGAYPSPLHYNGFPKSVCTSVNNVTVHGIPDLRPLQDGDIINVDITVFYKGFHGDCSKTFLVGNVDDMGRELVSVTEDSLALGVNTCGPGVPFTEIGEKIYEHAKKKRLTVLPAFLGHGIGRYFHGPPDIYHTLNEYPGTMAPGMTFTVEPCLSHGGVYTVLLDDGWTIVTADNSRAAQAEHTVLITDDGAEILTK